MPKYLYPIPFTKEIIQESKYTAFINDVLSDLEKILALNVINKIMPKIISWLNQDKDRSNNFVRIIYEYSTSRTKDSGKFVIAK